jgi:hypothetical protein
MVIINTSRTATYWLLLVATHSGGESTVTVKYMLCRQISDRARSPVSFLENVSYEGVSKSLRTEYIEITITTRWEVTQRVMATKLTRLTQKVAIQLHLVAESVTICSSRSRRPVLKLLDTPSYVVTYQYIYIYIYIYIYQNGRTSFLCTVVARANIRVHS